MAAPFSPPPTRILSWAQLCLEADPTFRQLSLRPWVYQFSNGRRFVQGIPVYGSYISYEGIELLNAAGTALAALTFKGGSPAGTFIGIIDVIMNMGPIIGNLSLSGLSAPEFQIVGTTLQTAVTLPPGSYPLTITVTDPTAVVTNSPFSASFTLIATAVPIDTMDIVTDVLLINQEEPWHPMSFLFRGLPPQQGIGPAISRTATVPQEQPWHPSPFARTGNQPKPTVAPNIIRWAITRQEESFHGNRPQVRFIAGPSPSTQPVPPINANLVKVIQEQPWHPQPYPQLFSGRPPTPAVTAKAAIRNQITVNQEYPRRYVPPAGVGSGPAPSSGIAPAVRRFVVVSQERPPEPIAVSYPAIGITTVSNESPGGTLVSTTAGTASASINASPSPGNSGSGNNVNITASGTIALNGNVIGGANVTMLYYIGHYIFQFGSGAWYGPIIFSPLNTGNAINGNPQPVVKLSGTAVPGNAPVGTQIGTLSVTIGNGVVSDPYGWTYTLSDNTHFQVVGSALETNATSLSGNYPLTITATPTTTIIGSPFILTTTITAGAESQDGFTIPNDGSSINASPTAGSAGSGNIITIVAGQIAVNGTIATQTNGVTLVYYIGHNAYQYNGQNYYGPITASGTGANPLPNAPQPVVQLSGTTAPAGSAAGVTVGTISVALGAGLSTTETFNFTYALSGTNANLFLLSGTTLQTSGAYASAGNGPFSVTITATDASILHGPWSTTASITTTGGAGGIAFPAVGFSATSGSEGSLATAAGQSGGAWPSWTIYNYYYGGGTEAQEWQTWGTFADTPGNPPYACYQVSPYPVKSQFGGNGINFNASDLASGNYIQYFNNLATNILNAGPKLIISVQLGWEWNLSGANQSSIAGGPGWDMDGQEQDYIVFMRQLCTSLKNICPTVIRCWALNTVQMASNTQASDWYPGDDVIDCIACDVYAADQGTSHPVNTTDRGTNWGWLYQMSQSTFITSNHPAYATGTMQVNDDGQGLKTITFPTGGAKYVTIPEWQSNNSGANGFPVVSQSQIWNWISQLNGRMLCLNYWNIGSQQGPGATGPNGDILSTGNQAGQQFVAATNGKSYLNNAPYPIPRLS